MFKSFSKITASVTAVVISYYFYCKYIKKDKYESKAREAWLELVGSDLGTLKRIGGNSVNYKVTSIETGKDYFLKLRGGTSSNWIAAKIFDRELLEKQFAGDHFKWMVLCTRLVAEEGLGAKVIASNDQAMVTEWVEGQEFGTETGINIEHANNPETMQKFGRFLGKLGRVSEKMNTDKEAQEISSVVLNDNPWNLKDPVETFSAYSESFMGWPNVKYYKKEFLEEWEQTKALPTLHSFKNSYGSQKIFVHSDAHAANFLMNENGDFFAIDLEMASVQPAAHLLYNIIWLGASLSNDADAEAKKQCARLNIAKGYLKEVSGMNEEDPNFDNNLQDLLFEIEYYKNRVELITSGMVARHVLKLPGLTSSTGLILWYILPRLKESRKIILEGLEDEVIRAEIAKKGIDTIKKERKGL